MSTRFFFARYKRSLKKPFIYGDKSLQFREGLIFCQEREGSKNFSEAAPLPGHSSETLQEITEEFRVHGFTRKKYPSLRFAHDSLFELPPHKFHKVECNALLTFENKNDFIQLIKKLHLAGYRTFKIKIRDENIFPVADSLCEIHHLMPDSVYRFDGNRALSRGVVLDFFSQYEKKYSKTLPLEYFEEPFQDFFDCPPQAPIAIAADESANSDFAINNLLENKNAPSVFIFKPMILGGFDEIQTMAKKITSAGKKIIYTTSLETEPGRRALIQMLSALPEKNIAGLNTGFLFEDNFIPDSPSFHAVPEINKEENKYLDSLAWEEFPC